MEIELSQIVHIGFADGLIWFPFVLGIGLLLTYLKEIDVSIDGIVVISGIVSAFLWRSYESYELSLLGGTITGLLGSSVVSAMQILLRIPGLMAGIILSLIAHSLSVLLIGESLVLPDTQLLSGFGVIEIWQVVLVVVLAGLSVFFYNMRFGMAIRKYGDGSLVNTVYSANLLKWSAYLVSGGLYGLGGALYVHSQGVAKSGGSFEFLIIALSAYLCTVRLGDLFHKVVSLVTWVNRFSVEFFQHSLAWLINLYLRQL